MHIERINLDAEYAISRVIKGGWHLAGGHGNIDEKDAIDDMRAFVEAGITTFDCADIYTGVEELIGKFLSKEKDAFRSGNLSPVQIHTKYVPDYDALENLRKEDTETIIDRSLKRLGVERLDLVQFAWWDYEKGDYIEAAHHLLDLQKSGKIRRIGLTNFDGKRVKAFLDAGISLLSHQVQYSVLDQRPEHDLGKLASEKIIHYLCYGVVAGGFLSNRYLGLPRPKAPFENRSLTKYHLIIEEFGGYEKFQALLRLLDQVGQVYEVGIAEVAARFILQKSLVAGVIIGARNKQHLSRLQSIFSFELKTEEMKRIEEMISKSEGPKGPVYALERDKKGKHGAIMRYNLNGQKVS